MASIINQSRYVVRVAKRPDLTRQFRHTKKAEAIAYQNSLLALTRVPATIEQLSNQLFVRIRRRGYLRCSRLSGIWFHLASLLSTRVLSELHDNSEVY
jgi:hypothetical protein